MIYPAPHRAAWTPEEGALLVEYRDAIAHALATGQSRLALRRKDGSWFSVVIKGQRILRAVEFNFKEKI